MKSFVTHKANLQSPAYRSHRPTVQMWKEAIQVS